MQDGDAGAGAGQSGSDGPGHGDTGESGEDAHDDADDERAEQNDGSVQERVIGALLDRGTRFTFSAQALLSALAGSFFFVRTDQAIRAVQDPRARVSVPSAPIRTRAP